MSECNCKETIAGLRKDLMQEHINTVKAEDTAKAALKRLDDVRVDHAYLVALVDEAGDMKGASATLIANSREEARRCREARRIAADRQIEIDQMEGKLKYYMLMADKEPEFNERINTTLSTRNVELVATLEQRDLENIIMDALTTSNEDAARDLMEMALEAIIYTRDYVGEDVLPCIEGWSWYDAGCELAAALPGSPWAQEFWNRVLKHKAKNPERYKRPEPTHVWGMDPASPGGDHSFAMSARVHPNGQIDVLGFDLVPKVKVSRDLSGVPPIQEILLDGPQGLTH